MGEIWPPNAPFRLQSPYHLVSGFPTSPLRLGDAGQHLRFPYRTRLPSPHGTALSAKCRHRLCRRRLLRPTLLPRGTEPLGGLPRRRGKRQLATPAHIRYWHRLVLNPRKAIKHHFAWLKRYFGLKYFQCHTHLRVTQYVLLTYIATATVALAAYRYGRPDLIRRRAMVLVHV